jgi:hypothetical protein
MEMQTMRKKKRKAKVHGVRTRDKEPNHGKYQERTGTPRSSRSLGRVEDDLWIALKSHADAEGLSFTQWAVNALVDRMNVERAENKRSAK